MKEERLFIDVNIPMYAAGKPHAYREASIWVLEQIVEGRIHAAIDTEIIQEVLYRFGSMKAWRIASMMANNLLTIMPEVYSVTHEDVALAIQLLEEYGPQGVKARDVIHAAVMKNHKLTQIISTDQHFDKIEAITRIDPLIWFTAE